MAIADVEAILADEHEGGDIDIVRQQENLTEQVRPSPKSLSVRRSGYLKSETMTSCVSVSYMIVSGLFAKKSSNPNCRLKS